MPKVSVIIPIYGVEKYIERCAISLFEQTLDDIEYIFVNDCTRDNSISILKDVLIRYPNRQKQTIIANMPKNSGLPAVREYGLKIATGNYIVHCDSDDWVDVKAYEKLYRHASENNFDIVFFDYFRSGEDGKKKRTCKIDLTSKEEVFKSITKKASWCVWSVMVKSNIYIDNDIKFPRKNNGEDFALMFQLIFYARSFSKIYEPLYFYYFNQNSITNCLTEEAYLKRLNQLKENTELVINFIKKHTNEVYFQKLIVCYKLFCRSKISPLTGQDKYKKIWKSVYPDLKFKDILLNNFIPLRSKLNYIAVYMNFYHILQK